MRNPSLLQVRPDWLHSLLRLLVVRHWSSERGGQGLQGGSYAVGRGRYAITLGLTSRSSTPYCCLSAPVFGFGALPKFSLAGAVDGGRLPHWVAEARSECSS